MLASAVAKARVWATPSPTSSWWPASSASSRSTAPSRPRTCWTWSSATTASTSTGAPAHGPGLRGPVRQLPTRAGATATSSSPTEPQDQQRHRPVPRAREPDADTYRANRCRRPATVTVSVLNGIGRLQPGHRHRQRLQALGFAHRPHRRQHARRARVARPSSTTPPRHPPTSPHAQLVADSLYGGGDHGRRPG